VHDVILPAETKPTWKRLTPEQLLGLIPTTSKRVDEVLEFALPSSVSQEIQDDLEREKYAATKLGDRCHPSQRLIPASATTG